MTEDITDIRNVITNSINKRLNSWHLQHGDNHTITFLIPDKNFKRYKVTIEEVDKIPLDFPINSRGNQFEKGDEKEN